MSFVPPQETRLVPSLVLQSVLEHESMAHLTPFKMIGRYDNLFNFIFTVPDLFMKWRYDESDFNECVKAENACSNELITHDS